MSIDIIGAGIGGLTTAIALEQKGIKTRIFEQAESIKPVGAGIILANNAMQVFDKLGLRPIIEANGNVMSSMNITKSNLKPLSKIDFSYFEKKHQTKSIAIHRGTLQQLLIKQLKSTEIKLNHKLTALEKTANGYTLNFENGKQIKSTTLIGADGLNSVVRENILPNNNIRNAKQICWRGVTEYQLPLNFQNELNEAWGKSERFGFVQIAENKVYWYALKAFKQNKDEFSVGQLDRYFYTYHSLIKNIIKATNKAYINTAEISDLKPTDIWYKGNACLIGDAAHAATPNMGQGACQAIEDAYVLSECLAKYNTEKAFSVFQKLRLPKAHQVVKTSWRVGKIAHLKNPLLIGFRNQVLKLTPSSINRKQNEQIFQLAEV
ncbi:FAD-dependent monooxygenase [uncultured Winogradskyella sp.]|uniref:FAD-dependent monooxygenase n=1 Tax=Winogradskyella sp. 4-2091 TaxID=3381659 RepID=UPI00261F850E|nr:FAD-dependent monooxygenase [uncultured Winogradskyella sp.]